ncbi:MAG: DUF2272 domain-containing protein [Acetobacteraceae bacterium]|nr:DUF2272 domain-containing protein [Acetobacteraceae bacterium]
MKPVLLALALLLGGCASRPPAPSLGGLQPNPVLPDDHVPDYAKRPFEAFSRVNAVAIAEREWRAFGSVVNDAPPGPDLPVAYRPDRQPGLWQRVGDYWWFGQNATSTESGWTGRYNEYGVPYGGEPPAWSAAFISYVMRAAGAGDRFPYSPLHADYINAAAQGQGVLHAEPPQTYAPVPGDLICYGRAGAQRLRFEDLPSGRFLGHCDMVVQVLPGQLVVIGGNVSAGVTMKHVPVAQNGTLADPDGRVLDDRYPWFVVLRVAYEG